MKLGTSNAVLCKAFLRVVFIIQMLVTLNAFRITIRCQGFTIRLAFACVLSAVALSAMDQTGQWDIYSRALLAGCFLLNQAFVAEFVIINPSPKFIVVGL